MEPGLRNRARLIDYANRSLCFTDAARLVHDLGHSLCHIPSARGMMVAVAFHDHTRTIIAVHLGIYLGYSDPTIAMYALLWEQLVADVGLLLIKEREKVLLN